MTIYPAIDIKDGQCVRLTRGDFSAQTVFDPNPAVVAKRWRDMGAAWLHVVDLDGARAGEGRNDDAVRRILAAADVPVQLGGGIRCMADVRRKLDMGVARVILGTAALNDPSFTREAVQAYGERVAVGVDAAEGKVAVSAWQEVSQVDAVDFIRELKEIGVRTVIYTDIACDGMMTGPNTALYERAAEMGLDIIASGGVSTLEDLARLNDTGVAGAIIGKALYLNAIDLREAVRLYG